MSEASRLLDVYRAIATIEDSRRTHAEWLDHWRRMEAKGHDDCAHCIETARVAGGREHQEKCIEEYDNVLAVLRSSLSTPSAEASDEESAPERLCTNCGADLCGHCSSCGAVQ